MPKTTNTQVKSELPAELERTILATFSHFAKRIDDMLFDAIAGEYGDKIIYGGKNADD